MTVVPFLQCGKKYNEFCIRYLHYYEFMVRYIKALFLNALIIFLKQLKPSFFRQK